MSEKLILMTKFNGKHMVLVHEAIEKSQNAPLFPYLTPYRPDDEKGLAHRLVTFNNWAGAYLYQQWLSVADQHNRRNELLLLHSQKGAYQQLVITPLPKIDNTISAGPLSMEMGVLLTRMKNNGDMQTEKLNEDIITPARFMRSW